MFAKENNIKIDSFNKKIINDLKKLNDSKEFKNILILGGVGVGKTYLAKKILTHNYFIKETKFKMLCSSGQMRMANAEEKIGLSIDLIKKHYPLEALCHHTTKRIIYDDYGIADLSPIYLEKMLFWIEECEKNRIIITTNLTKKQFEERDERISSRFLQNCAILILEGPDRRKENTKVFTS